MRIIQFIPTLNLAGAETMCKSLTQELVKLGHEVEIICEYDCNNDMVSELSEAVKIHFLHKKPGLDLSIIKRARKIITEFSPDIIHTHLDSLKYAYFASKSKGIKILHTVHNIAQYESSGISKKFNQYLFKRKKATPIALSEDIKKTICEYYHLSTPDVKFVYNGVQIDRIKRKQSYCNNKSLKIVCVARFSKVKNQDLLIRVAELLHQKYGNLDLTFIGDGDELKNCKQLVMELEATEYVHFLGVCPNVFDLLRNYDVFVLPSKYEGMPMSIIEAMAAGLAVIASDVGAVSEIIDDGENGLLCSPTFDDLMNCLMKLLIDRTLIENLGKKAQVKASMFSAKTMAENYVKIYEQLQRK